MDWAFKLEYWLSVSAIPLWLVLIIMLAWPGFLGRIQRFREAGPGEKMKPGLLLALDLVFAGVIVATIANLIRLAPKPLF